MQKPILKLLPEPVNGVIGKFLMDNTEYFKDIEENLRKYGTSSHFDGGYFNGYVVVLPEHPFYGRKHSAETIEKLRTINKHRVGKNNPTSRKIYADGLVFDSATECAKHFGKCVSTITHRVKSPNYPNFYYL